MALTTAAAGRAGSGLGARTQIVSAPVADQTELDAIIEGFGASGTVAGVAGALPELVDSSMPELPSTTGGAIGVPAGGTGVPF